MPELPEVEIVRKSLNKKISGKIINDVRVKNRNLRLKIPKNFEIKLDQKPQLNWRLAIPGVDRVPGK